MFIVKIYIGFFFERVISVNFKKKNSMSRIFIFEEFLMNDGYYIVDVGEIFVVGRDCFVFSG